MSTLLDSEEGQERLQLWGGHECTVNRVHNHYLDQSVLSGHDSRSDDIALFAGLGLKALRYPVLWEKVSPERPALQDFSIADLRLPQIRDHGIRPIVGLTHHGSGPRYTDLLDEGFAPGLAGHARAVAERFPWVADYTPVNEPLTTARFSCLYGIWYPHARNEGALWRALLNEIDATRLAMGEIRKVNPGARLVQTEDLGFTHATPPMTEQAAFENTRRWITWDLLCGMVGRDHPLWRRICNWGLEGRLHAILDDPCPPDVIGFNHYLSSERLLDHRVELYPECVRGGDGRGPYVNIEAVRTVKGGPIGVATLLEQTWERYGREIVITECHNGCTREEQVRWFDEVWRSAEQARTRGVRVTAVTAWGLLGSYDWNRLLAEEAGHYEPGVFDLRLGEPHPTAMAPLLRDLAAGREPDLPALKGLGWWRREDRFFDQVVDLPHPCPIAPRVDHHLDQVRPLLIVGPDSDVTAALEAACAHRNLACEWMPVSACQTETGPRRLADLLPIVEPWAVINLVGPQGCAAVAAVASEAGLPVLTWSARGEPEREPAAGELILDCPQMLTHDHLQAFSREVLQTLGQGRPFRAAANSQAPAIYLPDAANAVLDLLIDGRRGRIRLAAPAAMSWAELAACLAVEAGVDAHRVEPVSPPHPSRVVPVGEHEASAPRLMLPGLTSAAQRVVASWKLITAGRNSCAVEAEPMEPLRHAAE